MYWLSAGFVILKALVGVGLWGLAAFGILNGAGWHR
jgi:hypothetical protein